MTWGATRIISLACMMGSLSGLGINRTDASSARALQRTNLVLDWTINSDHGGVYAAMRKGFYRRGGIELRIQVPSDTTAQIKLVASGSADFGISYETDLLAARAQHIPVQSVMCIMQHPLDTVMTLKDSGLKRPRDLVGKTVGEAGSPSDNPILSVMMAHDHANLSQLRIVNVGYSLLPALLAKKVDAVIGVYWTWEAIQAKMKGHPVNVMRVERWGVPNYCELVLVASEATVRSRGDLVRAFVHATQEGYAVAAHHPTVAWDALHAAEPGLNQSLVLQSLRLLRSPETDAPTVGYQNATQWKHYSAWLVARKLLKPSSPAPSAFTNRFLKPGVR